MENYKLKMLIVRAREQDMSAFHDLFNVFKRLINFYASRLRYEDAADELTLFFIELLYGIKLSKFPTDEGQEINRYMAVAIKNKYIELSVKMSRSCKPENVLCDNMGTGQIDILQRIIIVDMLKSLNSIDKMIILYRYVYGYSIAEIAVILNITRQSADKRRRRALKILRQAIVADDNKLL